MPPYENAETMVSTVLNSYARLAGGDSFKVETSYAGHLLPARL